MVQTGKRTACTKTRKGERKARQRSEHAALGVGAWDRDGVFVECSRRSCAEGSLCLCGSQGAKARRSSGHGDEEGDWLFRASESSPALRPR